MFQVSVSIDSWCCVNSSRCGLSYRMSTAAERAADRRATWTIKRLERDDGRAPCPEDRGARLVLVEELSLRAWKLSGEPLPQYCRKEMPMVVIRAVK
ncbi:MAG: hypothetical protein ACI9MC_000557 [Kiritimatiellia bacterium]|jgi:hypothetical protein